MRFLLNRYVQSDLQIDIMQLLFYKTQQPLTFHSTTLYNLWKKYLSHPTQKLYDQARKILKTQTQFETYIHHQVMSLFIQLIVNIIPMHTTLHILFIPNYNYNLNPNTNLNFSSNFKCNHNRKWVKPILQPSLLEVPTLIPISSPNPIWNSLSTRSRTQNGFRARRDSTSTETQEKERYLPIIRQRRKKWCWLVRG